jgi:hypothetical protein
MTAPPPSSEADAAPADAAPADAAPAAAIEDGCHAEPDVRAVVPAAPIQVPAARAVCELADRVIFLDSSSVTVIERPGLQRKRGPITRTLFTDPCKGNGWAGCSMWARRSYWSPVLGTSYLDLGYNGGAGPALIDERAPPVADPDQRRVCRPGTQWGIASCSTAKRTVMVSYEHDRQRPRERPCFRMRGVMWTGRADEAVVLDGDLDRAASVDGRWVVRFPAQPPVGQELALRFEGGAAALEIGGQREACFAFQLLKPWPTPPL